MPVLKRAWNFHSPAEGASVGEQRLVASVYDAVPIRLERSSHTSQATWFGACAGLALARSHQGLWTRAT